VLLFIWLPLRSHGQFPPGASGLIFAMSSGLVLDLLVIPWPYVVEHYVRTPGDRWKAAAPASTPRLEVPTPERARSAAH
jgi:hypothetical protein